MELLAKPTPVESTAAVPPVASKATVAELVAKLQSQPNYPAQKAFYHAHPVLRGLIDPVNFSN